MLDLLRRLSIGPRLMLAFAAMLAVMALITGVGLHSLHQADVEVRHIVDTNVRKLALSEAMGRQIHIASRVLRSMVLLDDPAQIEAEAEHLQRVRQAYDVAWNALQQLPASAQGHALRTRIDEIKQRTRGLNDRIVELARINQDDEARALLMGESNRDIAAWQAALEENVALQEAQNHTEAQALMEANSRAKTLLMVLSAAALLGTALGAVLITRSITQPLAAALTAVEAIEAGRLGDPIPAAGGDECGRLLRALQTMQRALRELVSTVRHNAESVATASAQIAGGTNDLSSRTEEQASALEQTAASMEQLSAAVRQNADNATQANELARGASTVAHDGGQKMGRVVETMQAIHGSSRQIADITGVIDSIAFQTNILALNAAVEAARAGEQGRGFAVVASEVRTLAQRSADAARQIKALIATSVEQIEHGATLVGEAGATIDSMVEVTQRVSELIGEIHVASREQSGGVDQVRDAVAQMDHMTQQNASLVEESSAAADSLKDQSQHLVGAVARFQLQAG